MDQSIPLVQQGSLSLRDSTSFDTTLTTQQRPSIPYPDAPSPDATPQQVRKFLKQFFLANRTEMEENEAQDEAKKLAIKLRMRGDGFYALSKESLTGTFGAEGELIYNILQSAKTGYERSLWPVLKIISKISFLVARYSGAYQYGKESKDRNLIVTIVFAYTSTAIIAFCRLYSWDRIVKSRYWPEKLKIRNKTAAAVLPFVPW